MQFPQFRDRSRTIRYLQQKYVLKTFYSTDHIYLLPSSVVLSTAGKFKDILLTPPVCLTSSNLVPQIRLLSYQSEYLNIFQQ